MQLQELKPDWPDLSRLLDEALERPAPEREGWLAALDGPSAALRQRLRELLAAAADVDRFSDLPALSQPAAAGHLIGPYRLLREIGRGGMGHVWLAERADGQLKRPVALKLAHVSWSGGMDERLQRERDILAQLEHPNIARLYDAGVDDQGRPWLAIEHVEGRAIDLHCSDHGLDLRARIELLLEVAAAVAYAHSRLVIHRDLKPANVLVDPAGHVRLLDFGLAKLLAGEHTQTSALTQLAGHTMTPDYASPEQVRGEVLTTASDVYSLGVLAFELLARCKPYRLQRGTAAEIEEAILGADIPVASQLATGAALRRLLRGNLDAILQRAMHKDAAARYPSVEAFAADLRHHLSGRAVVARRMPPWQRLLRALRTNPTPAVLGGLALLLALAGSLGAQTQSLIGLALAAGAGLALWQRKLALAQAARAKAALQRAEQVKAFIGSIFTQAVPRSGRGGAVTAADLLRAAARRIDVDFDQQPELAAELGALIGASFNELGEVRDAFDWLPSVIERCTRSLGAQHELTLQSRWRWVEAANNLGEVALAEQALPSLLADLRGATLPALHLSALKSRAFVHTKRGREEAALADLHQALMLALSHFGPLSPETLLTRSALSNTLVHFARAAQALAVIEPALAPARAALAAQRPHPVLVAVERSHADALVRCGRPADALPGLRQVLHDQRALDAAQTHRVRVVLTLLGNAHTACGRLDEAAALLAEAQALHRRLSAGANDEGVALATYVAGVALLRGDSSAALRQLDQADAFAAELAAGGAGASAHFRRARVATRALALASSGRGEAALDLIDGLRAERENLLPAARVRLARAAALVLRAPGGVGTPTSPCAPGAPAWSAAIDELERALALPLGSALESGLGWLELAQCRTVTGADARAAALAALAAWREGQVEIEMLPLAWRTQLQLLGGTSPAA